MEFDLQGVRVMLGIPVNRDFPWQTVKSLMQTVLMLQAKDVPYEVRLITGCSVVSYARTRVADAFLKSECTHLFMLDSDQSWAEEDFMRVLCLATKLELVGAIYPAKKLPITFLMMPEATTVATNDYGCVPVKGMGLGFTCVSRRVIRQLAEKSPKVKFPESDEPIAHLFRDDDLFQGSARGEDMSFFSDCKDMGYTAWLEPSAEIGHIGSHEFKASFKSLMVKQ
jgi:hypothetical protein